jgi:hypothetical protein
MVEIRSVELSEGDMSVRLTAQALGKDVCVTVTGGAAHVGAVALSVARQSLKFGGETGVSTSILTLTGHKEDVVAKFVSEKLALVLNKNVVAVCGIHYDNITQENIDNVMNLVKEGAQQLCDELGNG